jgi:hypothetical protein
LRTEERQADDGMRNQSVASASTPDGIGSFRFLFP